MLNREETQLGRAATCIQAEYCTCGRSKTDELGWFGGTFRVYLGQGILGVGWVGLGVTQCIESVTWKQLMIVQNGIEIWTLWDMISV